MRTSIVLATLLVVLGSPSYAAARPPAPDQHRAPSTAGLIVWTNRAVDGREHLMVADADGTRPRRLTRPAPGVVHFDAQFSPDGRWIAYERGDADSFEVRLVRPDGTADHRLRVPCAGRCLGVGTPTWVRNRTLAVTRVHGPLVDDTPAEALLWTVRVDGSRLQRLSPARAAGHFEDGYAHASPDGSYLTFRRLRLADGRSSLFRADRGGAVRRLLPWGLGVDISDLSTARSGPTQHLLLFEAYGRGDPDATFVDLGTVPATCRTPRACRRQIDWLTDNEATGRRNANPHWSPNGRHLVFTDRAGIETENVQIWTMRYGGTERRRISTSPRFDYRPDWGRD